MEVTKQTQLSQQKSQAQPTQYYFGEADNWELPNSLRRKNINSFLVCHINVLCSFRFYRKNNSTKTH